MDKEKSKKKLSKAWHGGEILFSTYGAKCEVSGVTLNLQQWSWKQDLAPEVVDYQIWSRMSVVPFQFGSEKIWVLDMVPTRRELFQTIIFLFA